MNEFDELDGAIDNALESYTAGEPAADLPKRIVAAARATRRSAWWSGSTRAWTFAAAAALACVAFATLWMKSEHLQLAVVHTDAPKPAIATARTPADAVSPLAATTRPVQQANRGDGQVIPHKVAHAGTAGQVARNANQRGIVAGDEQLLAEGVEPIVFKPIEMAPIRMGVASQESQ